MDEKKISEIKPEDIGATNAVISATEHEENDPKDAEVDE